MSGVTTSTRWLLCCGCVLIVMAACTFTQPAPPLPQPQQTAPPSTPQELPDGKQSLAIFPWSITGGFEDEMLASTPLQRIISKDFPQLRRVWRGKVPNIETIVQLSTKLSVEAVFIYDMDISFGTDVLRVYLVDVNSQKIYEIEKETWDFAEDSYSTLLGMAQDVFTAYAHDRP